MTTGVRESVPIDSRLDQIKSDLQPHSLTYSLPVVSCPLLWWITSTPDTDWADTSNRKWGVAHYHSRNLLHVLTALTHLCVSAASSLNNIHIQHLSVSVTWTWHFNRHTPSLKGPLIPPPTEKTRQGLEEMVALLYHCILLVMESVSSDWSLTHRPVNSSILRCRTCLQSDTESWKWEVKGSNTHCSLTEPTCQLLTGEQTHSETSCCSHMRPPPETVSDFIKDETSQVRRPDRLRWILDLHHFCSDLPHWVWAEGFKHIHFSWLKIRYDLVCFFSL